MEKLLAKDIRNTSINKYLVNHTKMVINFGMEIGNLIYKGEDKDFFLKCLSITLALHDVGKIDSNFQNFMQKNTRTEKINEEGIENIKNLIRHNTISWAYVVSRIKGMYKTKYNAITSSILWHHTCYNIEDNSINILKNLKKDDLSMMDNFYHFFKNYINTNFNYNFNTDKNYEIVDNFDEMPRRWISEEKVYDKIQISTDTNIEQVYEPDTKLQLIRAILIFSDRLISSCECDLQKILDNDKKYIYDYFTSISNSNFKGEINLFNCDYDKERLNKQIDLLNETKNFEHVSIKACAGFGKTLFGIMWYFLHKKRVLWIVPRNIIAHNTYISIINELEKMNVNDKINVGVYYNNEIVDKNCETSNLDDLDILVTNIDSIVKRTTNNGMANLLVNMYTSNIIFDEYHEFIMKEGIFSAFIRLMRIRSRHTYSKSLLLSATASNFDCLWGENIIKYITNSEILFGNTNISIFMHTFNDIKQLQVQNDDTFVITYTVPESQKAFYNNKYGTLIHARYCNNDRKMITDKILKEHGKKSCNNTVNRQLVIGTNIIGTGLDISCRKLYDFVVSPESTIQRACGRVSRFGEYNEIEYHICTLVKNRNNIISNDYNIILHKKWLKVLEKYNTHVITKNKLYELYENFQKDNKKYIEHYYYELFNDSSNSLLGITVKNNTFIEKDKKYLGKGLGYRGNNDSIFITAKTAEGIWCEPFAIDTFLLDKEGTHINEIKEIFKHKTTIFKYPSNEEIKYKYGIKRFTIEEIVKSGIAKCNESPLPLFDYIYDKTLGLLHKSLI